MERCPHHTIRSISRIDNLELLKSLGESTIDLVYLDPPFNSGRSYDARVGGLDSPSSFAFNDIWDGEKIDHQFAECLQLLPDDSRRLIGSLVAAISQSSMSAYLRMIIPRLVEIRRVLTDKGSLYLHCDPTASHYLKVALDAVIGAKCFRNEIIWKRTHAHSGSTRYGPVHDVVLFYAFPGYTWNAPFRPYDQSYLDKYFTKEDENGIYQLITCTGPGPRPDTKADYEWQGVRPPQDRHWAWKIERMEELDRQGRLVYSKSGIPRLKRYADEGMGVRVQDIWTDIHPLSAHSNERSGYETQKPVALLERIIGASSNPGDRVLDPFCGSGTTAVAAEALGRSWTVADSSLLATSLTLARVRGVTPKAPVELVGFPNKRLDVDALLEADATSFALWATAMTGTLLDRKHTNGSVAVGERSDPCARTWVQLSKPLESVSFDLGLDQSTAGTVVVRDDVSETVSKAIKGLSSKSIRILSVDELLDKTALVNGGVGLV